MIRNKPEIVSPAGNLEKLKFAVTFGADSVFFGGGMFNLRDKAGNFSPEDISEAVEFCRTHDVKTTFLLNSFLHEKDIDAAEKYIKSIEHFDFHAVMISDPGMLQLVKNSNLKSRIYLSTQMSTLNRLSVKFWKNQGIDRIVLARETTLKEIESIRDFSDDEIEVFVHGALCISYSGRCLLSRFMSGRDANLGECSQPCRWKFSLMEEKRPGHHFEFIEHATGTEILSSKDLCLLRKIPDYINAGVNAFKLEGRMKSLYYVANVTRIYKNIVENIIAGNSLEDKFPFWESELDLISHRPYTDDLFNEFDDLGFRGVPYIKKVMFMGYADAVPQGNEVKVKVFNPIHLNDRLEAIAPIKNNIINDTQLTVVKIFEDDTEDVLARPGRNCRIIFDKKVPENAIFRKRILSPEGA
ncbi:MAG: U32 family peptidase [Spirochaetes bacterium]|nr:U32 family peptidase [Spirochaetota bacterium]